MGAIHSIPACGKCFGGGKEHLILEVDVPVQIFLEVGETGEEGPVGVARIGGRVLRPLELAESGEGGTGVLMLAQHAGDGTVE